jgi:hypothetical protein
MHPETHRHLHAARSAELRHEAAVHRLARSAAPRTASRATPRVGLRTQIGWTLVELGLRLVRTTASGPHEQRFRTAGAQ